MWRGFRLLFSLLNGKGTKALVYRPPKWCIMHTTLHKWFFNFLWWFAVFMWCHFKSKEKYYTAIFWLILRLQHWYFQSKLIWQKQHWDCFNKESLLKYNKRPARVIALFTKLERLGSSGICYTYGSREEIIQIPFFFPKTFFFTFLNFGLECLLCSRGRCLFASLKVYWGITCTLWPEFFPPFPIL